jgi:hypothetical protein
VTLQNRSGAELEGCVRPSGNSGATKGSLAVNEATVTGAEKTRVALKPPDRTANRHR